ncbi:MAG: hypothetical protein ABUK01_05565 [Leptospirales bacterium]
MKKTNLLMLPILLFVQCNFFVIRNPQLTYSLVLLKDNVQKTPPDEIVIYEKDSVTLYMKILEPKEIAMYLVTMNMFNDFPDNSRVPPLTFVKYRIKNNSDNALSVNFLSTYFTDSTGLTYNSIGQKDYETSFTSASYQLFKYHNLFSLFVTTRNNIAHSEETFYEKVEPGKTYDVKKGEEVTQIIAYKHFSSKIRDYNFTFFLGESQKSSAMRLIITRSDQEK